VILSAASSIYGAAASWRRRWYARDPERQRRLSQPVVSVGNLRAGGSGKTPIVEHIARLLLGRGQRPAILTRGYARRLQTDGVTVVSDGASILAGVETAGDEPLMLARALPGVRVLVGADRYLSGRLAEHRFAATVHLLDDGFQHLALARDVDLLVVCEDDLTDRPLPSGWLREPLGVASAADALLVTVGYESAAGRVGRALGVPTTFRVSREIGPPRMIASGESVIVPTGAPVFAVAGIARPEGFFTDIEGAGWHLAGTLAFRDHHPFGQRDVDRIAAQARSVAAAIVLTTEKDAMRLAACDLNGLPIAAVPLEACIEPADLFQHWLFERLRVDRTSNPVSGTGNPPE
jgi:tetraacyldisaccharide 4'-kinase